jgi:hypothetical protein
MGNKLIGKNGINAKGLTRFKGKGSTEEHLPDRMTMSELTKGSPVQRSLNNYAKATPSGVQSPGLPGLDQPMDSGGPGVPNTRYSDKF